VRESIGLKNSLLGPLTKKKMIYSSKQVLCKKIHLISQTEMIIVQLLSNFVYVTVYLFIYLFFKKR
jgi:hypothetical protein